MTLSYDAVVFLLVANVKVCGFAHRHSASVYMIAKNRKTYEKNNFRLLLTAVYLASGQRLSAFSRHLVDHLFPKLR